MSQLPFAPPFLLAATLALCPALASAQDAQRDLDRYVLRENINNGLFTAVGAASVAAGSVLLTRDDELLRGAGYPLVIAGSIQLVFGVVYLAITPGIRARGTRLIATAPAEYRRVEGERIDGIVRAFPWIYAVDGALVLAGGATLGIGLSGNDRSLTGVGIGCLAAGVAEVALDLFGGWTAREHSRGVRSVGVTAGVGYVGLAGVF